MVGVVMCHKDRVYIFQSHTHSFKMLFHDSGAYTCIDKQTGGTCLQIIAVSAATRTQ